MGCISQDPHIPGLYNIIWDRISHCTGVNYIRQGCTMCIWKISCSIWASKNDCRGCRWTFSGMFKNTLQDTLLIPVHAVSRVQYKAIINEWFYKFLNKVHKIKSADKGRPHQCFKGVFLHCMLGMKSQ